LFYSVFALEDGGSIYLRNNGELLSDYTASQLYLNIGAAISSVLTFGHIFWNLFSLLFVAFF
jgi:hypothetical protein